MFGRKRNNNDAQVYTASSLAAAAGVTSQAVTKACREGRIPGAYQVGDRWIIPRDAGDLFVMAQKNE
jgi:hypothetical protein